MKIKKSERHLHVLFSSPKAAPFVMIRVALSGVLVSSVVIATGMWTKMLPVNVRWAMATIGLSTITAVAGALVQDRHVSRDVAADPASPG